MPPALPGDGYSHFYDAEDAYRGNLVGALEALNASVTTVVDHCHIINTPDHAHEAARGLIDASIRAQFCYGFWPNPKTLEPFTVVPAEPWRFETAVAMRRGLLASDDAPVRFGVAPSELEGMPFELSCAEIKAARERGAACISMHVAMGAYDGGAHVVQKLHEAGLLGSDMLFVHGAALTWPELELIAAAGAGLSSTPVTELQMGMSIPVTARALDTGVAASIGVNIVSNYAGDMFTQVHRLLQTMRAQANGANERESKAPHVTLPRAADLRRLATAGGARAAGLCGSEAATNSVVRHAWRKMLFLVYGAVVLLAFVMLRSWRAVVAVARPTPPSLELAT